MMDHMVMAGPVLNKFGGLFTECPPENLPPGASPQCYDIDFLVAGVRTRDGTFDPVQSFTPEVIAFPITYLKSTTVLGPNHLTLAEDNGTTIYEENLNNPGVFSSIYSPILNQARAISTTVDNREFICLSNLIQGQDEPRQYDGTNVDRISQVGPGNGPLVTVTAPTFDVISITEIYPAVPISSTSVGANMNLHDAQPASTNLFFYSKPAQTDFTTGLKIGQIVYVSGTNTLSGAFNPNGTYRITFIGAFSDSDGNRQVFGVTASVAGSGFDRHTGGTTVGSFQRTDALVLIDPTTPLPLNQAVVGNTISIQGASVSQWNRNWGIQQTPTEGQLGAISTSLTSNIATYDYTLQSGIAPGWQANFDFPQGSQIVDPNAADGTVWQVTTPGTSGGSIPAFAVSPQVDGTVTWTKQAPTVQVLVTVFNTNNGNGIFNVQNQQILLANQTSFTVAITHADVGAGDGDGLAVSGSGTSLIINPGLLTIGTGNPGTNPIYGNATGGTVLVVNPLVAAGQRWAVLLFLTRNGYITPASPPVSFFTTTQTGTLTFDNLTIGPPNVIARIVAFTLANAGPGGPYFYVPQDVIIPGSTATFGLPQTINSTVVRDNTSTSDSGLVLSDAVLATGINISEVGNNLQQQRELAECVKPIQFAARVFYLGERVKNDQLINMTFDGGTLSTLPAGWTIDSTLQPYISIITSPPFEQLLYIHNTSGGVINPTATPLASIESLNQTAFVTTGLMAPIIQPSTKYSIRVFCSNAAGLASGSLVMELYSPGLAHAWQVIVPMSEMGMNLKEFVGDFGNPLWNSVPDDLLFRIYPLNIANNDDLTVYRMEVFPTDSPIYTTQVAVSYADNPEAIDGLTGKVDTSVLSSETQTNHYVFLNKYYITTAKRTYAPSQSAQEPAFWNVEEISDEAGCFGPLAADGGEEYRLTAGENGLYIFDGGNHSKISQEIQSIWDFRYKPSDKTVWVLNDLKKKRILVGFCLPTPNQWLPEAPINAVPAYPNIILECCYLGLNTGTQIAEGAAVVPSAFTGTLLYHDMRRKWTIWQIPAAIGAIITRPSADEAIWFGQEDLVLCHSHGCPSLEILLIPSTAGDFVVPHSLGVTPCSVIIQMISSGKIWFQLPVRYDADNLYLTASDGGIMGYAVLFG